MVLWVTSSNWRPVTEGRATTLTHKDFNQRPINHIQVTAHKTYNSCFVNNVATEFRVEKIFVWFNKCGSHATIAFWSLILQTYKLFLILSELRSPRLHRQQTQPAGTLSASWDGPTPPTSHYHPQPPGVRGVGAGRERAVKDRLNKREIGCADGWKKSKIAMAGKEGQ